MARHRTHSIEFKRQVAQDYLAGETLHSLARRHDLSRNLVRIWIQKFEAGAFDDEAVAADTIEAYEARIAALERLVGRQALEIEFLKGGFGRAIGLAGPDQPGSSVWPDGECDDLRFC
ncbi:transposase [Bosea sp. NBC_00550]|uniref:transposase n=1 Tax=Bosea sp. NBC_00550 TaxID=2969621 RepID=UPI002231DEB3|nr:transposase [Bosea sp. NBC_00550]UZF95806.1 transposase [Bosea sp. NBC_00550]